MKVRVFGLPDCPKCIMLRDFLKEHKVKFEDLNVKDEGVAREMITKSGQKSVPVIEIDDEIIVGFDEEELLVELDLD
ncbi:glutaredoxin family protein [archaeon]|jgi:glutaredoxin 3|nr:glutaredoxin family protein [archaeon]